MYEFTSRIRYSECGEDKYLKVQSLVDYFQDCSTFQAEAMGIGLDHVDQVRAGWILASWQIRLDALPRFGDEVRIATWPYYFDKLFGHRNFTMRTKEGELLACADSYWIYFDMDKGRPIRIPEDIREAYTKEIDPELTMEKAPRRITLPEGMKQEASFSVLPGDIDTNHHVNNGRYVRYATNYLMPERRVKELRVEYAKAAVLGDTIFPRVFSSAEETVVSLDQENGKPFAVVQFLTEN